MKISSLHEWLYSFRYIHWIIDAFFWHSDFHVRSVIKIDENGGLDSVKIVENHGLGGSWSGLGCFWDVSGEFRPGFLDKLSSGLAQARSK